MRKLFIALVVGMALSAWADDLDEQMQKLEQQKAQLEIEHVKAEAAYQTQVLEIELHIKQIYLKKLMEENATLPDDAKKQLDKLRSAITEYMDWAKKQLKEGVEKAADELKPGQKKPEHGEKPAVHQQPPVKTPPKGANVGQETYDKAVRAYDAQRFEDAAKLFHQAAGLFDKRGDPKRDVAGSWYNEACSWSLAGKEDNALEALGRAIDAGYDDVDHLQEDSDLASLHDNPKFQELVKKLKK